MEKEDTSVCCIMNKQYLFMCFCAAFSFSGIFLIFIVSYFDSGYITLMSYGIFGFILCVISFLWIFNNSTVVMNDTKPKKYRQLWRGMVCLDIKMFMTLASRLQCNILTFEQLSMSFRDETSIGDSKVIVSVLHDNIRKVRGIGSHAVRIDLKQFENMFFLFNEFIVLRGYGKRGKITFGNNGSYSCTPCKLPDKLPEYETIEKSKIRIKKLIDDISDHTGSINLVFENDRIEIRERALPHNRFVVDDADSFKKILNILCSLNSTAVFELQKSGFNSLRITCECNGIEVCLLVYPAIRQIVQPVQKSE